MNVTDKVPVLFKLFSYSLSELQQLLTGVQGLRSAQCKAALEMPTETLPQQDPSHLNTVSHYTKRHSRWPSTLQCCTLQLTCDLVGQTTRLTGMMLY